MLDGRPLDRLQGKEGAGIELALNLWFPRHVASCMMNDACNLFEDY